ncbi:MAG TPA: DUF6504 family protein [Ornithinicoccus sp.]|nr:DUF6504 family protein [Ornithinicoccus sp.]
MSRRYAEEIEVRVGEPLVGVVSGPVRPGPDALVPTAFVWRGRVHVVRAVLGHWTQRLPWWRAAWSDEQGGPTELEQEVWRVEASAGRLLGTGVYDLAHAGSWRLLRVAD